MAVFVLVASLGPFSDYACFSVLIIPDRQLQGIGTEVFRMLIPADWQFEGGVQWVMNNPGMPAVGAFRAYNPQGVEAFEAFPNLPFFWTNNPMVTMQFPPGSFYFGNEVRPPASALQVLQEIVIPRHRGQMPGLQVVAQEQLPQLAQQMRANDPAAGMGVTGSDGGRVRIRYRSATGTLRRTFLASSRSASR